MYRDYLNTGVSPFEAYDENDVSRVGETPFKPEYEQFIESHTGRGSLKVQISVAREAYPIKGVVVDVSQIIDGVRYSLYNDVTDISGIVDNMVLPARSMINSLNAETAGVGEAEYLVTVYHPDFETMTDCSVTVYDKIETILPISLEPRTPGTEGM